MLLQKLNYKPKACTNNKNDQHSISTNWSNDFSKEEISSIKDINESGLKVSCPILNFKSKLKNKYLYKSKLMKEIEGCEIINYIKLLKNLKNKKFSDIINKNIIEKRLSIFEKISKI